MLKVVHISPPDVFTACGQKLNLRELPPSIKKGDLLELVGGSYVIKASTSDVECPGGQCPVK